MSQTPSSQNEPSHISREQLNSALFAQLVIQQANMAMMLLGKVAHPETGKTILDVEAAKLFIDQLEMLETKTKGNLTREEEGLLKQSLMTLHMAFVETMEAPELPAEPEKLKPTPEAPAPDPAPSAEEPHKRFSKKY